MASRYRKRVRVSGMPGLAHSLVGLKDAKQNAPVFTEECWDNDHGFGADNPFLLERWNSCYATTSGRVNGYWVFENWNNYISNPLWRLKSVSPSVPVPSDNEAYGRGLAQSNPNRPQVALPVFYSELRELPRMVKDHIDVFRRKAPRSGGRDLTELPVRTASSYLEWQFGIAPFISDLQKLLTIQKAVDSKIRMLERFGEGRGVQAMSATVYENETDTGAGSPPWWEYPSNLYQERRRWSYTIIANRKVWTSTRWTTTGDVPRTDASKSELAWRLAHGWDLSLATIWQGFPWTWLLDWFTNIGDAMSLTRNTLPVRAGNTCVMRSSHVSVKKLGVDLVPGDILNVRPNPRLCEIKQRIPMGVGNLHLEIGLPFLSGSQAAVLSSLSVLKTAHI